MRLRTLINRGTIFKIQTQDYTYEGIDRHNNHKGM